MAYKFKTTKQFDKDVKRCIKRGLSMEDFKKVIDDLVDDGKVDPKYKPHRLSGNRRGQWECHIHPNWLLVWLQNDEELTLLMLNTGTNSDLF